MTRWHRNDFGPDAFDPDRLAAERRASVAVCIPAHDEALTIAGIVADCVSLRDRGTIDRVVVIADRCTDDTPALAEEAGAEVRSSESLMSHHGAVAGKGDVMWRALAAVDEDIVCYVDGDSRDFGPHFVTGLIGPLVARRDVAFVKAQYRRPFTHEGHEIPDEGGRVSTLVARPLLRRFYPELGWLVQPLAGEIAARRDLLERVPFEGGYGVETGMLIDVLREEGVHAMAQVDLGARRNAHKSLRELAPMADVVLATVLDRARRDGRLEAGPSTPLRGGGVTRPALRAGRVAV